MKSGQTVSMKQIAEKLHISTGAVSLTLNGRGDEMRISAETQKLIVETAKEMGYSFGKVRKNVRTIGVNDLPVIVVFMPVLTGDVISPYDRVLNGLNRCIREHNVQVEILVCPFEYGKLYEKYRYIAATFCTGAIVFSMSEADMEELLKQNFDVPVVVFNRINEKYSTVYVDDYKVGYQVAKLFYGKGCKKTALFTSEYRNKPMVLRQLGFEEGCAELGIELLPENKITCRTEHADIREYVRRMCDEKRVPDMIFANMDDIGLGIIKALQGNGVRIPEDVEMISYGNNVWTELVSPTMSTICLDIEEMSGECLLLLWDAVKSGKWSPVTQIHQSKFIYRESMSE